MKRMRLRFGAAGAAALVLASAHAAEEPLDASAIKGAIRVESITIPTPGEFFTAIDKQGRPNWVQLVRTGAPGVSSSRAQIALALGTLVADGFIAVEAEDGQAVKNIGKEIINLSKKLNVSQSVLGRGNSLNDFAASSNWSALREELEATQNEVKLDMSEQKDESLITLVTVGAWLRGTEITSGLVEQNYTDSSARLLHQPAIVDYLLDQLAALPESLRKDPLLVEVQDALKKARQDVAAKAPSADNVKGLHATVAAVVAAISARPAKS